MVLALLALSISIHAKMEDWTPEKLLGQLAFGHSLSKSESELRRWFGGKEALKLGANPKVQDLTVAFAIEVSIQAKNVSVVCEELPNWKSFPSPHLSKQESTLLLLTQVGSSNLFVGALRLEEGQSCRWHYSIDGKSVDDSRNLEVYTMPPESRLQSGKLAGKLVQQPRLTSTLLGGTWHDWWLYSPPNFDPTKESNLVVFQDGQWAHNYAPAYFDNLVSAHKLDQTVVIFLTPGTLPDNNSDRSREYDTLNDLYSRFLLEEVLPPIESRFKITQDPMKRCITGLSSGGICSFTVAWHRPEKFGLVLSWIGSFANIASGDSKQAGGHNYPALIRKTDKKPIRVFIQEGLNDLDNVHGNWPLGNLEMVKALEFQKYDVRSVFGNGFHSDLHGRATMVEALLWLFQKS